jgi:Na+-driven multidrug efflux pump
LGKILELYKSKSLRNYFFTFAVEMFVALVTVFVVRLSSTSLNEEGSSGYLVSRRMLSTIQPFLILGLGVAMPRFIAMAVSGHDPGKAHNYLYASMFILFWPGLLFLFVSLIFPNSLAYLFFANESFSNLIFPLGLQLVGALLHMIVYGYFRGTSHMSMANFIQFINMGIVPLVVFYFAKSAEEILYYTAFAWIGIASVFLFIQVSAAHFDLSKIKIAAWEMFVYGVVRVPGDFLLGLFMSLPMIMVNHSDGVTSGKNISVAFTFLQMAAAVFTPICLLLLTDSSQLLVKKDYDGLRRKTNTVLKVTIALTLLGIGLVELLSPFIIHTVLKVNGPMVVLATRIAIVSALGYTIFISLRSVLDAYYVKPVNTLNIAISVAVFAATASLYSLLHMNYIYILCCFIGSMFLLGLLTWIETNKVLTKKLN